MDIGKIKGFTRELGKPQDWDDATMGVCKALPIIDIDCNGTNVMVSEWKPTPEELIKLMAGNSIKLWLFGQSHPPVMLTVGELNFEEDATDETK